MGDKGCLPSQTFETPQEKAWRSFGTAASIIDKATDRQLYIMKYVNNLNIMIKFCKWYLISFNNLKPSQIYLQEQGMGKWYEKI